MTFPFSLFVSENNIKSKSNRLLDFKFLFTVWRYSLKCCQHMVDFYAISKCFLEFSNYIKA